MLFSHIYMLMVLKGYISYEYQCNISGTLETVVSMEAVATRRQSSGMSNCNLFPTYETIQMAKSVVKHGYRVWKLIDDLYLYIPLATLLTLVLNTRIPISPYIYQKSIFDTFVRVRYKGNISFTEVN